VTDPGFTDLPTVARYAASLDDDLTATERELRLHTLRAFADFVGRTPDQMVGEIFDTETRKYRKRGFYATKIKEFTEQLDLPPSQRVARGNIVRAFFIANGRRVPPETPAWLS
jgi:tellurite resistance protein